MPKVKKKKKEKKELFSLFLVWVARAQVEKCLEVERNVTGVGRIDYRGKRGGEEGKERLFISIATKRFEKEREPSSSSLLFFFWREKKIRGSSYSAAI